MSFRVDAVNAESNPTDDVVTLGLDFVEPQARVIPAMDLRAEFILAALMLVVASWRNHGAAQGARGMFQ